ncbi:MAG: DEAD/DEAH box helicase family protein [Clostridiales bacterium]|nr:DEAD/DEAH box helicase family protein [Clostridiales bacterium]
MSNFEFLKEKKEYELFASAAVEAERVYVTSPAMCAVGCRKALELAVKWVYSADNTMQMPYRDNLQSLIHEQTFRFAVDYNTWGKLPYIIKLGNLAVHTEKNVQASDALASLRALFEFIQWVDYCYGSDYIERKFDESLVPKEKVVVDTKKIKEQESLLGEKDAEIEKLRKQIEAMSEQYTSAKEQHKQDRSFTAEDLSEFQTRKIYIDVDMKQMGWKFSGTDADVREEYPVDDMAGVIGQKGYADYVLFGKDGLPLAVVEAKRTSKDPNIGRKQAMLYADCLEKKFGRRPVMFTTNGFETFYWDDRTSPQRKVSSIFSKDGLQKLINRRMEHGDLISIPIDDRITDRYYQKEAIRAVCEQIERGFRKHLLVMSTGTGKTRTAASLTDVLSRAGYVTNILFLADRTALVKQAKDDFKNYLPEMSLCNLCSNKDDSNARIVFSTYPTMLNAIDQTKTAEGIPLFTPEHFDLIIIDESHRSIFKKYRAIFEYFDAIMVGLTATPKTDVDRNTYDFFEMEHGVPTYAYDYETVVEKDHVLVPYYNYEVKTKFLEEGITYDDLSEEDKERYEDDFIEDGTMPEFIPSAQLNKFVFNETTVDLVLQDLMERGIKVAGGERIGKTIIFAQNKRHAEFILERFNKLYPKYKGKFAQRVICDDTYAQTIIDDFKVADKEPHIVVSVDMMDTGIDVPECVNLVFFKKVRSKAKFWQMIGRGTRLCKGLTCFDQIDGEYIDKRRFLIFDYCGNFEYFREHKEGYETRETKSLSEAIFGKQIKLAAALQEPAFSDAEFQTWRGELVSECQSLVQQLSEDLVEVRLRREFVEKYKKQGAFDYISENDKGELLKHIAPVIHLDDWKAPPGDGSGKDTSRLGGIDELALRFDNFMYGLMLASVEQMPSLKRARGQLCDIAVLLEHKAAIPQVKAKLSVLKEVQTDAFWDANDLLQFERVRKELRELIKFLDNSDPRKPIITRLTDSVIDQQEGNPLDAAYDFEDYRKKVNRYVMEHGNTMAIYKLTHNIRLSDGDYQELERILTSELGSQEDYQREYGDTPFGLLIRRIAKMDHDAAMQAFSAFINDESLNQRQIAFVYKIINHIEQNGYMESVAELTKPPFDKPLSFTKLFDARTRTALVAAINQIKENAVVTVA